MAALRLGVPVIEPIASCPRTRKDGLGMCGELVDAYGYHALSCKHSKGFRHSAHKYFVKALHHSVGHMLRLDEHTKTVSLEQKAEYDVDLLNDVKTRVDIVITGATAPGSPFRLPLFVDPTLSAAHCSTHIASGSDRKDGVACETAERAKMKHYGKAIAADSDHVVGFAMEMMGRCSTSARKFLRWVALCRYHYADSKTGAYTPRLPEYAYAVHHLHVTSGVHVARSTVNVLRSYIAHAKADRARARATSAAAAATQSPSHDSASTSDNDGDGTVHRSASRPPASCVSAVMQADRPRQKRQRTSDAAGNTASGVLCIHAATVPCDTASGPPTLGPTP